MAIVLTIYLAISASFSVSMLPSIFATIANVFGIALVVIFLGHGLISLPKYCFLHSSNTRTLTRNYKTANQINSKLEDLEFEIDI